MVVDQSGIPVSLLFGEGKALYESCSRVQENSHKDLTLILQKPSISSSYWNGACLFLSTFCGTGALGNVRAKLQKILITYVNAIMQGASPYLTPNLHPQTQIHNLCLLHSFSMTHQFVPMQPPHTHLCLHEVDWSALRTWWWHWCRWWRWWWGPGSGLCTVCGSSGVYCHSWQSRAASGLLLVEKYIKEAF